MKSDRPLSNALSLVLTVSAAIVFFVLLMVLPSRHRATPTTPGGTPAPAGSGPVPARDLFLSRCTQCHALPTLTHRTTQDWRILVLKMNRYMQQTGHLSLSDAQADQVTRYILRHRL